jgi:hypothetical protein
MSNSRYTGSLPAQVRTGGGGGSVFRGGVPIWISLNDLIKMAQEGGEGVGVGIAWWWVRVMLTLLIVELWCLICVVGLFT